MKTPAKMRHGFCAVRRDEMGEYLDMSSYECLVTMTRENATAKDAQMPGWAKANPIVRIACVTVKEMR